MKRAKSILSAFVLTCALCSTTFAGHITSARGHITSASGHITSASGHITSARGHITSARGHITSARTKSNTFDLDLLLVSLLMRMPWF